MEDRGRRLALGLNVPQSLRCGGRGNQIILVELVEHCERNAEEIENLGGTAGGAGGARPAVKGAHDFGPIVIQKAARWIASDATAPGEPLRLMPPSDYSRYCVFEEAVSGHTSG